MPADAGVRDVVEVDSGVEEGAAVKVEGCVGWDGQVSSVDFGIGGAVVEAWTKVPYVFGILSGCFMIDLASSWKTSGTSAQIGMKR